jgi:hypothetical protein
MGEQLTTPVSPKLGGLGFNELICPTFRSVTMSNTPGFDFTQFVPGFDFLKNLGAGTGGAANAASAWVAPTMDPEELDKRIQELKTVQFWLEQNAKALGATIQAMEVQRMTLSTLKSMNMNFQDMVDAAKPTAAANQPGAEPTAPGVDPAQWWNALTQQFQNIASQAVQDMGQHAQAHAAPRADKARVTPKAAAKTPRKPAAKTGTKGKTASR